MQRVRCRRRGLRLWASVGLASMVISVTTAERARAAFSPGPASVRAADDDEGGKEPEWEPGSNKYIPPILWYEVSPERKSKFFMLLMVYWEAQNPERQARAVVPLFYQRRNYRKHTTTWLSPLFYWKSTPDSKAGYVPPFYIERGKNVSRTGIPPVFWYGRVGQDVTSYLFPLYFYDATEGVRTLATPIGGAWGTKDDWQGLVGPYYWRRTHDGERNLDMDVLFPVVWRVTDDGRKTLVLGPAFRQRREASRGPHLAYGLPPLFYRRTAPGGGSTTVTPVSVFERQDGTHAWMLSPVGGFRRRGAYYAGLWGPFYRATAPGRSDWFLLPGVWYRHRFFRDDSGQTRHTRAFGALPLYYWRSWDRRTYAGLAPVFFYRNRIFLDGHEYAGKRSRSIVVLPLFGYREEPGSLYFLSPFYVQLRRHADRRIMAAWLYWDYKGDDVRTTTLLPFYHWDRTGQDKQFLTLVGGYRSAPGYRRWMWGPVYHRRAQQGRVDETVVFPLYWNIRNPQYHTMIAGPYWRHKTPLAFSEGLLPVWWHRNYLGVTHTAVFPFFYTRYDRFEREYTFATPLGGFWRSRDPDAWKALVLNLYLAKGPQKRTTSLLPLLWYDFDHGDQTLFVPPFFTRRTADRLTVTTFPLFHYTRRPHHTRLITPGAFFYFRDYDTRTSVVPLLLYHWTQTKTASSGALALWMWSKRLDQPGTKWHALFPLYFNSWAPDRRTFFLAGYFRHTRPERTITLLPGLGWTTRRDPETKSAIARAGLVGPLYWHVAPGVREAMLFPLAGFARDRNNDTTVSGVFPLYLQRRSGKDLFWTAPALLSFYRRHGNNHLGVYGPLVDLKRGDRRSVALFPIFHYGRSSEGAHFASLPFIWWLRTGEHTRAFVGLGYWNTRTGTQVWPLYARWQEKAPDGRVNRNTEVGFPLYWRFQTPERDVVVVPPFYRVRRSDGTRIHGIAVLWSEELGEDVHTWSVLGDLIAYQRKGRHRRMTYLYGFHQRLESLPERTSQAMR